MILRKAKVSDVEQVYDILLEMISSEDKAASKSSKELMKSRIKRNDFKTSAEKELIREFREKNSLYLLAEINSEIVGYVRASMKEQKDPFFNTIKIGFLDALAVKKNNSGKGIASALNKEAEKWLKEQGCTQIRLEVFNENPAIDIYKKWNYKAFNTQMIKKI